VLAHGHAFEQSRRHAGLQRSPALHHCSYTARQLIWRGILEQVALRAYGQRRGDILIGIVGRQHQEAHLRGLGAHLAHHLDPAELRQPQIQQHHVGRCSKMRRTASSFSPSAACLVATSGAPAKAYPPSDM
jgi:hypothetical protein